MTAALTEPTMTLPEINGEDFGPATPPPPVEAAPGTKTGDPHAPYGYTRDGKPRAKPGVKKRTGGTQRSTTTRKIPPAPSAKSGPPRPPSQPAQPDYRAGFLGLVGEGIGAIALVGLMRGQAPLIADAAAIDNAAPALADLVDRAANQWPIVAAILDKVLAVGPHVGNMGALVVALGQLAVNHRRLPAGLIPGTVDPDTLGRAFIAKRAAENEQFASVLDFVREQQARYAAAPAQAAT